MSAPRSRSELPRWLTPVGAVLIVFLAVWLFVTWPDQRLRKLLIPPELNQATVSGDYAKAVATAEAVINDPNKSVEAKALAIYNYMGARYRVSGDIKDRLLDIRDIKTVILNSDVSAGTRANAISFLAGQFSNYSRDPAIFAEIYKDAPFSDYLVAGDPDASARRLFEWSYSVSPTSDAAASIAVWYASQGVYNSGLDKATRDSYNKLSADYLALADGISLQEERREPGFVNGLRYLQFRVVRTITIGLLAAQGVEPYVNTYREGFDAYLAFAAASDHVLAKAFIPSARLAYAHALYNNGDTEGAKAQLDTLAVEMSARQDLGVGNFILTLRNQSKYESDSPRWKILENAYTISPNFKAAVESAIAQQ